VKALEHIAYVLFFLLLCAAGAMTFAGFLASGERAQWRDACLRRGGEVYRTSPDDELVCGKLIRY
jgi:hypothetical protein